MSSRGEVIGINTAVIAGAQGICFGVASNTASHVVSEIVRYGRVRRAFIGVAAQTVPLPRRLALALDLNQSQAVTITGADDLVRLTVVADGGLQSRTVIPTER